MKKYCLFITAAAAVVAGALAGTGPDSRGPADDQSEALKNQVNELQTQIHSLETRLRRLESTADRQRQEPLKPPTPMPFQFPSGVMPPSTFRPRPEIWGERQINGWTFYVVPCETNPQFSTPVTTGSR